MRKAVGLGPEFASGGRNTPPETFEMTQRMRHLWLPCLGAALALVLLAGCGGAGYGYTEVGLVYEDPYYEDPCCWYGSVEVDNLSAEYVETFYLAPWGTDAWTGELLGWPLAPWETALVGDFQEDSYDAWADLEWGDYVEWWSVYVPGGDVTVFEVW